MDSSSSFVYSLSRPLHPMQAQTKQYLALEEYAYQNDIQALLHGTLAKLFKTQPADPLAFIIEELKSEKQLRDEVAFGGATGSSQDEPGNEAPSADPPADPQPDAPGPQSDVKGLASDLSSAQTPATAPLPDDASQAPSAESPGTDGTAAQHQPEDVPAGPPPVGALPAEAPPADAGPTDAPPPDVPTAVVPPADVPQADAPPAVAPSADAPSADAPSADAPSADATSADAPPADATDAYSPPADATYADSPPADAVPADTEPNP